MSEGIETPKVGNTEADTAQLNAFKERLLQENSFDTDATEIEYQVDSSAFFEGQDTSPRFSAEGKQLTLKQSNEQFRALLEAEGWPKEVASSVFFEEIQPLNERVVELMQELKGLDSKSEDTKKGLKGLSWLVSESEGADQKRAAQKELREQLAMAQGARLVAMRKIVLDPESYLIDTGSWESGEYTKTRSFADFKGLLEDQAFDQAFELNRQQLPIKEKERLCEEALADRFAEDTAENVYARKLIFDKCVRHLTEQMLEQARTLRSASKPERAVARKRMRDLDQRLATMMHDILFGEDVVQRYGNLIIEGVSEDIPLEFPELTLRLPERARIEMSKAKNRPHRTRIEWQAWAELVGRYDEERLQGLASEYTMTDEAGHKPVKQILTELEVLLQEAGYDKEQFVAARSYFMDAFFKDKYEINRELRKARKNKVSPVELRGLSRRRQRLDQGFLQGVRERLEFPAVYKELDLSMANAQALIEKQPDPTDIERLQAAPDAAARAALVTEFDEQSRAVWVTTLTKEFGVGTIEEVVQADPDFGESVSAYETAVQTLQQVVATEPLDTAALEGAFTTFSEWALALESAGTTEEIEQTEIELPVEDGDVAGVTE